jgi:DNA (cytosine-5)-methyltransferase 1
VAGLTCLEICAGAGGQSPGLAQAGFAHEAAVELDRDACDTLRRNRGAEWKIIQGDVHDLDGRPFAGIDLFAAGQHALGVRPLCRPSNALPDMSKPIMAR